MFGKDLINAVNRIDHSQKIVDDIDTELSVVIDRGNKSKSEPNQPVWLDDDDNEVVINLNKSDRLKKLKKADDKSIVTGNEFSALLKER